MDSQQPLIDAVTAGKRLNHRVARAKHHLAIGLLAAQDGRADIAAEKIEIALAILDD